MPIFGKILGQPLSLFNNARRSGVAQSGRRITPTVSCVGDRLSGDVRLSKAASAPSIDGSHVILQIDKWHGVLARPLPHVIFKIEK